MEFPANVGLLVESHVAGLEAVAATVEDADPADEEADDLSRGDLEQIMGLDTDIEQAHEFTRNTTVETFDDPAARDDRVAEYDGNASLSAIRERVRETAVDTEVYSAFLDLFSDEQRRPASEPGTLDLRRATRYVCGDTTTEPYEEWTEVNSGNVAIGVSLDQSGSMGKYEVEAKAAVGAFLESVQLFGGDVVANAWQGGRRSSKSYVLTGPTEQFEWEHLLAVEPGGKDPISAGMLHCAGLLDQLRADEKLLLVVHDGHPTVLSRADLDTTDAKREAAETVEDLRDEGITVIGVGFGGVSERNLARMFGTDEYVHTKLDQLADALVTAYRGMESDRGGS